MPSIITDKQLERLKGILPLYRKILGYSAEKLGSYLGLKRQQINSLETGRTKLTQIHYRAISQIIHEIIAEKLENNEVNISLFIIQIILGLSDEYLDDEEFLYWENIMIQFSQIKSIGNPDNQIKLLKGFAIASKDLDKGDIVPTIDLLDDIVAEFKKFIDKINSIIDDENYKLGEENKK